MQISRRAWLKGFSAALALGCLGGGLTWWRRGSLQDADLTVWMGFSPDDVALLNEIADLILPATDTPGAKAADVGAFMAIAVAECYEPRQQAVFLSGLRTVESLCHAQYDRGFREISASERVALLSEIDGDRKWRELWNKGMRGLNRLAKPLVGAVRGPVTTPHYFTMMKELAILGYFTSEAGATQALRHDQIPGHYNGALPYQKGDRAWSL